MKRDKIAQFEIAINEIRELINQLPSGIDYEADENNLSPADATAHVGGLVWKVCERVLPSDEIEKGETR
jgi:hypothetical protein